jgi:hypothetical protein
MQMKNFEARTIRELEKEFFRLQKTNQWTPKKLKSNAQGDLLLTPADPLQREWWENEKEYGLTK